MFELSQVRKNQIKKGLKITAIFVAGAATAAVVIRYRQGIALNEAIWTVPIEVLRENVKPGSRWILDTPNGEMFVTKVPLSGGMINL